MSGTARADALGNPASIPSDVVEEARRILERHGGTHIFDGEANRVASALLRASRSPWRPVESVPKDENASFLVLLPKNDVAPYVVLQVSWFEGRMYPDARNACIDWDDGITTATHWMPLPQPPSEGEAK